MPCFLLPQGVQSTEGLRFRLVDAKGQVVGRLASQIATILQVRCGADRARGAAGEAATAGNPRSAGNLCAAWGIQHGHVGSNRRSAVCQRSAVITAVS